MFVNHPIVHLDMFLIFPTSSTIFELNFVDADMIWLIYFQVLRLATELLPATFALMGADQVSPFWAVLTYFIFIMFGIAQQLAIWHCVITGIMAINAKVLKKWESTITFFSCACGFILGLPMATEVINQLIKEITVYLIILFVSTATWN